MNAAVGCAGLWLAYGLFQACPHIIFMMAMCGVVTFAVFFTAELLSLVSQLAALLRVLTLALPDGIATREQPQQACKLQLHNRCFAVWGAQRHDLAVWLQLSLVCQPLFTSTADPVLFA